MNILHQTWFKRLLPVALIAMACAAVFTPWAAQAGSSGGGIDVFTITMKLFGGLAIFLYGMAMH